MSRRNGADETKAHRVELVQRAEFAVRVPPFRGQPGEFGDLLGIDGGTRFRRRKGGCDTHIGGCGHVTSNSAVEPRRSRVYVWPAKIARARPPNGPDCH